MGENTCTVSGKTPGLKEVDSDIISKKFVNLLSLPTVSSAHFIVDNENVVQVSVDWSATDVVKKEKIGFTKVYTILKNSLIENNAEGPIPGVIESQPIISNGNFSCLAKSGSKRAVILNKKPGEPKDGELLQIFDNQTLFKTYDLKELDKHSGIITSPFLGNAMAFSDDETKLLYLAEAKIDKAVPFFTSFGKDSDSNANVSSDKPKIAKGEEFAFRQSWGEKMSEVIQSVIVVLDIEMDVFQVLDFLPRNIFPSDLQWVNDTTIIGVAYENTVPRLGLAVCNNRKSRIFRIDIDGNNFSYLNDNENAAFSPRVRPDGNFVIWQERKINGPHRRAHKIIGLNLVQGETPYILYETNPPNQVPVYEEFPQNCWSCDGQKFFTVTSNEAEFILLSFKIGQEKVVATPEALGGISAVVTIGRNFILAYQSTRIQSPSLLLLDISSGLGPVKSYKITAGHPVVKESALKYLVIQGRSSPPSFYYGPSGPDKSVPLVVLVHGGPHCSYVDQFTAENALLLQLGFGILSVNYFGSTGGKSDDVTDALCGNAGRDDLTDCHEITQSLLAQEKSLDPKNVFVFGGSHGGFLGAHLMSSYPDFYKAAVLLNPVTDLTAMVASTDIPDWCYAESGAGEEFCQNAFLPYVRDLEDAKKFMDASPIMNVDKVKGAILMLLGTQDLRVPMSQGFAYYRALKLLNKETELRVYNDNHSLYKVPCRLDVMVHSALWFCNRAKNTGSQS